MPSATVEHDLCLSPSGNQNIPPPSGPGSAKEHMCLPPTEVLTLRLANENCLVAESHGSPSSISPPPAERQPQAPVKKNSRLRPKVVLPPRLAHETRLVVSYGDSSPSISPSPPDLGDLDLPPADGQTKCGPRRNTRFETDKRGRCANCSVRHKQPCHRWCGKCKDPSHWTRDHRDSQPPSPPALTPEHKGHSFQTSHRLPSAVEGKESFFEQALPLAPPSEARVDSLGQQQKPGLLLDSTENSCRELSPLILPSPLSMQPTPEYGNESSETPSWTPTSRGSKRSSFSSNRGSQWSKQAASSKSSRSSQGKNTSPTSIVSRSWRGTARMSFSRSGRVKKRTSPSSSMSGRRGSCPSHLLFRSLSNSPARGDANFEKTVAAMIRVRELVDGAMTYTYRRLRFNGLSRPEMILDGLEGVVNELVHTIHENDPRRPITLRSVRKTPFDETLTRLTSQMQV